jgi:hypothetical protein
VQEVLIDGNQFVVQGLVEILEDFLVAFHAAVSPLGKQKTVLEAGGDLSKTMGHASAVGLAVSAGERVPGC